MVFTKCSHSIWWLGSSPKWCRCRDSIRCSSLSRCKWCKECSSNKCKLRSMHQECTECLGWWWPQRILVCNATSKSASTLLLADAAGRIAAAAQKVEVAATKESAPCTGTKSLSFKIKANRFVVWDVDLKSRKTSLETRNVPVLLFSWWFLACLWLLSCPW